VYGELANVVVPIDRTTSRNKGFAFVAYRNRADAENARDTLLHTDIEHRRLRVDWDVGVKNKETHKDSNDSARQRSPMMRGRSPPRNGSARYDASSRGPPPYSNSTRSLTLLTARHVEIATAIPTTTIILQPITTTSIQKRLATKKTAV